MDNDVFGNGGGVNINMDDFRIRAEFLQIAGDAVIESCAHRE